MLKKEKRIDIMVDIETLGVALNSPIFQISAACFDIETGKILEVDNKRVVFDQFANLSKDKNLNVDGNTLIWWIDKYPEMLKKLLTKDLGHTRKGLLEAFSRFLQELPALFGAEQKNIYLWGNGINFDNNLIKYQIEAYAKEVEIEDLDASLPVCSPFVYPINYAREMDYRTIMKLASYKIGIKSRELRDKLLEEYKGINKGFDPHDAMEDVLFQIYSLHQVIKSFYVDLEIEKRTI